MKPRSTCLPLLLYACAEVTIFGVAVVYLHHGVSATVNALRRDHREMASVSSRIPGECVLLLQRVEAKRCEHSFERCWMSTRSGMRRDAERDALANRTASAQHDLRHIESCRSRMLERSDDRYNDLWNFHSRRRMEDQHAPLGETRSNRSYAYADEGCVYADEDIVYAAHASLRSRRDTLIVAYEQQLRAVSETTDGHVERTTRALDAFRIWIACGLLFYACASAIATYVFFSLYHRKGAHFRLTAEVLRCFVHDLKVPCASLQNAIEARRLDLCETMVQMLTDRIADYNDLFTLDASEAIRWNVIQNAKAHFRAVAQMYEPLFDALEGSRTRFVYEDDGLPENVSFMLDDARFTRAVENLVSNARKYTSSGCVVLRMGLRNQTLVAEVSDTGTGIDPVHYKTLGKRPHVRLQVGTNGHGIGLFSVRRFLDLVGGSIAISTNKRAERGTCVEIRVPVRVVQEPSTLDEHLRPQPDAALLCEQWTELDMLPIVKHPYENGHIMYRVLVVEDDAFQRVLLRNVFDSYERFVVSETDDKAEAKALCGDASFDAIITNRNMSVMDGQEFIRWILRGARPLPSVIVLVTANPTEEDKLFVREASSKIPVDMTILLWDKTNGYIHLARTVYDLLDKQANTLVHVSLDDNHTDITRTHAH
ncbi:hypothetical protein CYMTET_7908 [Cymbomonas tetramitiformis]|uniref:Histidine kinase n=1 Tax=Cymbomonas tetramitiformis TaxID=36881 RepID=A0AAE0LH09_9CHLO|nr:hypothetical protein CYMTET_7908 [Cymbomonas tetramitiformis]